MYHARLSYGFPYRHMHHASTTSIQHIEKEKLTHGILHDTIPSMKSILYMARHRAMIHNPWHQQIQHERGPTYPILALAYKTAKLELRNTTSNPTVDQE